MSLVNQLNVHVFKQVLHASYFIRMEHDKARNPQVQNQASNMKYS